MHSLRLKKRGDLRCFWRRHPERPTAMSSRERSLSSRSGRRSSRRCVVGFLLWRGICCASAGHLLRLAWRRAGVRERGVSLAVHSSARCDIAVEKIQSS